LISQRKKDLDGKIFVFNFDAHDDRFYSYDPEIHHDRVGSWANDVEKDDLAYVIHMRSYWRNGILRSQNNWRDSFALKYLLEYYNLKKKDIREVWISVDYDFFALYTSGNDNQSGKYFSPRRIYDLHQEGILSDEFQAIKKFFLTNKITVTKLVPAISRPWLNMDKEYEDQFLSAVRSNINNLQTSM